MKQRFDRLLVSQTRMEERMNESSTGFGACQRRRVLSLHSTPGKNKNLASMSCDLDDCLLVSLSDDALRGNVCIPVRRTTV